MANTLTNILPQILARGLMALREQAIMPRLVAPDFGRDAAAKGSVVDIPTSKAQTANDVTAAPTHSSAQSNTPGVVQLTLDQWKHSDFFLTDKEMVEVDRNRHFVPMQTAEAIKSLSNAMDQHIHAQYTGVYGFVGTAGVVPFSAISTTTDARKVLSQQLAPIDSRVIVVDPTAEGQALQLAAYRDLSQAGDQAVPIRGEMGQKMGFNHFMSQNVTSHTAGTQAAVTPKVYSTTAVGASALDITSGSALGTIVTGDVFTIAGDSQTYVHTGATITTVSAGVAATIDPALKVIASADSLITMKASHTVNLAFHPQAFAFANRPLISATADISGGNMMLSATDDVTGLSLRLEVIRQFKQNAFDFDVLYGAALIRPELAARIAG